MIHYTIWQFQNKMPTDLVYNSKQSIHHHSHLNSQTLISTDLDQNNSITQKQSTNTDTYIYIHQTYKHIHCTTQKARVNIKFNLKNLNQKLKRERLKLGRSKMGKKWERKKGKITENGLTSSSSKGFGSSRRFMVLTVNP